MANNVTDLGKVGMTPKRTWSSSTTYERLDVVTYEGSSYVSLVDSNTNNNPSTSSTKWQLMAAHGEFTEAQLEEFKAAVVAASEEEMDEYTDTKKGVLDDYTDTKKTELNTYTGTKKTELDTYTGGLKTDFNDNATSKTTAFNTNATNKTTDFNDNASSKTTAFNTNASDKTTAFNTNASDKTTAFDNNASAKQTAFDSHVEDKIDEFDDNAADIQQEIDELAANMPWETPTQATEFNITDAAKYSRNKLELFGNTEQTQYTGKNLYNATMEATTTRGITRSADRQRIYINGTVESAGNQDFPLSDIDFPAGTYTLSYEIESGTITGTNGLNLYIYSDPNYGRSPVGRINADTNKNSISVELTDSAKLYIHMYGQTVDASYTNVVIKYQITNGSDADYNFEPYTGGSSPNPDYPQQIHVVTGNNTIGVQGKNSFNGLISGYIGNNGNIIKPRDGYCISDFIIVDPNTQYTLSGLINNAGNGYKHICEFDENEQFLNRIYVGGANTEKISFTTTATTKYIVYGIFSQFSSEQEAENYRDNQKIQLEQGSTATDYEPYTHQDYPINLGSIELCKIGDYQDYLYKENGNWYKYGAINKVILDGTTERWGGVSTVGNFKRVDLKDIGLLNEGTSRKAHLFCSISRASTVEDYNIAFSYNDRIFFYLPQEITTGNEWAALLSQKLPKLYYILATPVATQITDATLISQLDAIYEHLQLTKGTNNITVTASDLAPYMKLNYMQDLPSKLDNLESRLSLLE